MKKEYINPEVKVIEIEVGTLCEGSFGMDNEHKVGAGSSLSREGRGFGDDE